VEPKQPTKGRLILEPLVEAFAKHYGVELEPAGKGNWRCACPFHGEQIPSFTIFVDDMSYYCFGCGAVGFLNVLLGEPSDLKARLKRLEEKESDGYNINLAFGLTCLRVTDKLSIWGFMRQFDDAPDYMTKQRILEFLQNKGLS